MTCTSPGSRQSLWSGPLFLLLIGPIACDAGTHSDSLDAPTLLADYCPSSPPSSTGATPPPPISGGTLLVTHDDSTVVVADPDRDSVWFFDTALRKARSRLPLPQGSEPGRLVEDAAGKVHVVLRRSGKLVQLDPVSGQLLSTRPVCPAPRGLAYDLPSDTLHVACAGGELVSLRARDGQLLRSLFVDVDLRDVIVKGDHLLLSRFRSAELLELDSAGALLGRVQPRDKPSEVAHDAMSSPIISSPNTAWRIRALPDGSIAMLHQRASNGIVSIQPGHPGSYGATESSFPGPCRDTSIVSTGVTLFQGTGAGMIGGGMVAQLLPLAFDLAVSPDGKELTLVGAGLPARAIWFPHPSDTPNNFFRIPTSALGSTDSCQSAVWPGPLPNPQYQGFLSTTVIAAAYDSKMNVWAQSQDPVGLYLSVPGQPLSFLSFPCAEPRSDVGHNLFHAPTAGLIACANCHPEAGDDHHTWSFDPTGPRRTQSLRGGLLATAPFHWDGDLQDISSLMNVVFTQRMSGGTVSPAQTDALARWLDAQPTSSKSLPADPQAVTRGQQVFSDPSVGCATCHSGSHFSNNLNADVGTGHAMQVPSLLGIWARAPYMHDGCATTLRARFDPLCGGGDRHGQTSMLSPQQIDDLVAYLQTL